MKQFFHHLICCLAIAWTSEAFAYNTATHAQVLTTQAVIRSLLQTDASVLRNLGLDKGVADESQKFPNSNTDHG